MPTVIPSCLNILLIIRVVVVLPLVPVIDTMGIANGIPSGNIISSIEAAEKKLLPSSEAGDINFWYFP